MELSDLIIARVIVLFCCLRGIGGQFGNPLNKYIDHYEGLSYDKEALHNSHQRAKRALSPQDETVHLDFHAHGRHFNLRLKRETQLFSPDLIIDVDEPVDTSHIYSGEIFGEPDSLTHGSVLDGRFEGFIKTHQGTFYVEPAERYLNEKNVPFHSVIYHEDNVHYPHKYGSEGGCADRSVFERMKKYQESASPDSGKGVSRFSEEDISAGPVILRKKRAVGKEKNTCPLYIQTDHTFYKRYGSREAVIAQISSHVKAVNIIYQATDFMGIRNIGFMVKRVRINTTNDLTPDNPFRFPNIGVEKFLDLNSEQNHNDYCLAYVFTDRDFDDGVLGLAWVGSSGSSGGICDKNRVFSDGKSKSLNTGIITVQNYGAFVPPKVSHITFAHEVGHNFGSPHDSGAECTPGESKLLENKERGNYIMYARATSGDKSNNNRFSICSIRNISQVLLKKKDVCFVESGQPICGNGIVEEGEECDCGYRDQCRDPCCYSANEEVGKRCKLQPGKSCSPSQGLCCTPACDFAEKGKSCRPEGECALQGFCSGDAAACPASEPKANLSYCHQKTQVCLNGLCSGSVCQKFGLELCSCAIKGNEDEAAELCHVCCMEKTKPSTCSSTRSPSWAKYFNNTTVKLLPGSPCDDFKGYCDDFSRCRLVDADGPLARLKKAIFNPELYENIADWIAAHWWAVLLMVIALILLMAGFIQVCSVHTPSNNPYLPVQRNVRETLQNLNKFSTVRRNVPQNYQMGAMTR